MRNLTFRRRLSLLVAFVFLLTTAGPSVFAASKSVAFKSTPSYTAGQNNKIGLTQLSLQIVVPQGTTTPQALKLKITGKSSDKFFLTADQNTTKSAAKSTLDLNVATQSAVTWSAIAYLGIADGKTLQANDSIKIEATDTNNDKATASVAINVSGGGNPGHNPGGSGGPGGGNPAKPVQPTEKPKTPTTPDTKPGTGTFYDVKSTDWFRDDVEYVVKNGLFNGVSATSFAPHTSMSRGMIVTALGRLAGADMSAYTSSSFGDIAAGQYYSAYVEWAKANGIVNGVGGNSFAPDREVSRQDFAVILVRYAEFAKKSLRTARQPITFADEAQIAGYAKNAVRVLSGSDIVNGMGKNTFGPGRSATRAEVAAMLHRFAEATK
jgi:hypothetical protein